MRDHSSNSLGHFWVPFTPGGSAAMMVKTASYTLPINHIFGFGNRRLAAIGPRSGRFLGVHRQFVGSL